jgi:hypothetical protein
MWNIVRRSIIRTPARCIWNISLKLTLTDMASMHHISDYSRQISHKSLAHEVLHKNNTDIYDGNTKKTKPRDMSPRANYTDRATHRLPAKLVPTFDDRGCHVVSVTDPYCHILGFLDRSRYFFFQVAPQLYSRGWVDPVSGPLLLRKSFSAGSRTRASGSVARNSDH